MSERVANVFTGVLTACAVIMTGLVARRELFTPAGAAAPPQEVRVQDWKRYTAAGSLLGGQAAPIRLVEFSDFQCPFCASASATLRALRGRYPGKVTVVYRHFPLESIHRHAFDAAVAAECASAQGRFEAFHDALFARQDSIGAWGWERYAANAGVPDSAAFSACVRDGRFAGRVRRDMDEAKQLGVRATPSFVFDGKMVTGADALPAIDRWVRRSVAQ